jgi:integrase/recombinase XerD
VATRNQRLAVIQGLAHFVGKHCPEGIEWCEQLGAVPFQRTAKTPISHLDEPEMDALLAAPDRSTRQGRRDYALPLFLYNTGARADEAAHFSMAIYNSAMFSREIIHPCDSPARAINCAFVARRVNSPLA